MLPFIEHRKHPSNELMDNLEPKVRVALERYMAHFAHRCTGNMLVDEFNGIDVIPDRPNGTHKRICPPTQTCLPNSNIKRATECSRVAARYAKCNNRWEDFDFVQNPSDACNYHDDDLEVVGWGDIFDYWGEGLLWYELTNLEG